MSMFGRIFGLIHGTVISFVQIYIQTCPNRHRGIKISPGGFGGLRIYEINPERW